jgi:hypothetical protein
MRTRGLISPDNNPGVTMLLLGNAQAWRSLGHDPVSWLEWISRLRETCPGPIGQAARRVQTSVLGNVAQMVFGGVA